MPLVTTTALIKRIFTAPFIPNNFHTAFFSFLSFLIKKRIGSAKIKEVKTKKIVLM